MKTAIEWTLSHIEHTENNAAPDGTRYQVQMFKRRLSPKRRKDLMDEFNKLEKHSISGYTRIYQGYRVSIVHNPYDNTTAVYFSKDI